jgi:hypothetical protein
MNFKNTSALTALILALGLVAAPVMADEADLDNDGVPMA